MPSKPPGRRAAISTPQVHGHHRHGEQGARCPEAAVQVGASQADEGGLERQEQHEPGGEHGAVQVKKVLRRAAWLGIPGPEEEAPGEAQEDRGEDGERHAGVEGSLGRPGRAARPGSSSMQSLRAGAASRPRACQGGGGSPPLVPVLGSISVTPAASTAPRGTSQQFTAIGSYSDGSSRDLTTTATWVSSDASVATINASGLAIAANRGTATVSATSAGSPAAPRSPSPPPPWSRSR